MLEYPTSPLHQAIYRHVESIDGCKVFFEKIGGMMRIFWEKRLFVADISVYESTAHVDIRSGTWPYPHVDLNINSPRLLEDISEIITTVIAEFEDRTNSTCSKVKPGIIL